MTYKCEYCVFKTGSRKKIRKHVQQAHHIKKDGGGKGYISPVTKAYTRVVA